MQKQLYLTVLWHMHQPYYKDDLKARYAMPWAFLHGIKDYYDMLWYLEGFPSIKSTFNLVPSLLVQLKDYEDPDVGDAFLQTLRKEVHALSHKEKLGLLESLFFAQKETMIEPIARYAELYRKIESATNIAERIERLSDEELLDLEVCFLLAWCGVYLRENSEIVGSLLVRHRFSQEDKIALMDELSRFVATIIPYYHRMQECGRIEISTTPFYHPIMPLLMDPKNAMEADPEVLMPGDTLAFAEDAALHVEQAKHYYDNLFGKAPRGVWPSEGSVDNSSLELYIQNGLTWACSDEAIILKSLKGAKRDDIYRRFRLRRPKGEISLFFRDRTLSDAIGFDYSRTDPENAAADFIAKLRNIYDGSETSRQVNVILDGENAWEYYRNNARDFFEALYRHIAQSTWITTQTMEEATANTQVEEKSVESITPGSWINANFAIWIGQDEKNRAWELLYQTKRDLEAARGGVDDATLETIQKELMIAQGSDWYWWFGDTHYTAQKAEFDKLFRKHLKNVYTLMGREVPVAVMTPVIRYETKGIHVLPKNPITIAIDGAKSSFFEWMGAGEFNLEKMGSVMDSSTPHVKKLLYGNDAENLNIALIGSFAPLVGTATMLLELNGKKYAKVPFSTALNEKINIGCSEEFVEFSLPLAKIKNRQIDLKITLSRGNEMLQKIPFHSVLHIDTANRNRGHWFI